LLLLEVEVEEPAAAEVAAELVVFAQQQDLL
jgi:hypothetical protein